MIIRFYQGWFQMLYIDVPLFLASTFSISESFYLVSPERALPQKLVAYLHKLLPALMALGIGLTITNSKKAVLEALVGHQSAFARTPAQYRGHRQEGQSSGERKNIASDWAVIPYVELLIGTLFRHDGLVRDCERELHHGTVPDSVRLWVLVHRIDVTLLQGQLRDSRVQGDRAEERSPKPFPVGV